MAHHLPATLAALLTLAVTCVRSGSLLDTTTPTISPAPTTSTIPPASTTPTIPPAPTTPKEPDVIDTQEQIYIISGVFGTLIFLLLLVSIFAGVKVISLQQKLRRLERGRPATPPAERPAPASTKRPAPQPSAPPAPRGRDNRGFRPDDEEERRGVSRPRPGDELQDRGFRQYPGQERYGAGNLARLPKGPSPGPGGYDRGYSYSSDEPRRTRGPRSEPEYSRW